MTNDPVLEHSLAEQWGLPKATLAAARKEILSEDEFTRTSKGILLPYPAVEKVRAFLGVPILENEKEGPPETADLTISRVFKVNRRVVEARGADALPVTVRVKNNRHLRPGMVLPACAPTDTPSLYQFSGQLPRR